MMSKPLSQIIEIPDVSLNEKLVAANDNEELTALSREHLAAESILAGDDIEASRSPVFIVAVLCLLLAFFVFGLWSQLA